MRSRRRVPAPRPPRHAVEMPAQIVRLEDFRLLSSAITNLSSTGALSGLSADARRGEQLIVSFQLPRTQVWVDVDAVVTRVVRGHRSTDPGRQVGLAFTGVSATSQRWIQYVLEHSVPVPPLMRPGRRDRRDAVREFVVGSGWVHSSFGQMLLRWSEK